MLADELDYVIGVDTHLDEHVLAVVAVSSGAVVARRSVRASARGYSVALQFAREAANGARVWAIEGAGHYGAGLARYLACRGETVLEISRVPRAERRLRGKDDALDAARTARAVLASETLALPRSGERREALRLLLVARRSAVDVRREALGQLRAVVVTAPDQLRQELQRLPVGRLLDRCRRLRRSSSASADELATRLVLRSLSRRIEAATLEAAELERELLGHVRAPAPRLLEEPGVRDRRCAADRRLVTPRPAPLRGRLRPPRRRCAGTSLERPNDAASAQPRRRSPTQPRLHTIVLHRRQHDPTTQAYIARRIAEGKSRRDATRLLKRYLARHLYRLLQHQEPLMT
jgi:transposase